MTSPLVHTPMRSRRSPRTPRPTMVWMNCAKTLTRRVISSGLRTGSSAVPRISAVAAGLARSTLRCCRKSSDGSNQKAPWLGRAHGAFCLHRFHAAMSKSGEALLLTFFLDQLQRFVVLGADAFVQLRIGLQNLFPRRENLVELARPLGAGFFREAAFNQLQHDRHRNRSAGRCAEQCGKRAILRRNQLGAKLQHAAFFRIFLDDLHPLPRHFQAPVLGFCLWIEATQRFQALLHRLHHFADQVLGQVHVVTSDGQHRFDVGDTYREGQVEERAMLEELGGETGIWPEQQGLIAIDHASVQVRHRHRRRTHGGLAVDLGLVMLYHFRVIATQPLATDRKTAKALALFDARHLQQRQCRTACAEEHEFGVDLTRAAAVHVLDHHGPACALAGQAGDTAAVLDLRIWRAGQVVEQLIGQRAKVDVSAVQHARCGDFLVCSAAGHHQRHPLGQRCLVFGVFHRRKRMVLAHGFKTGLEERDAVFALHETQVRDRIDERLCRTESAFARQKGPELLRDLELGIDVHGFLDVDGAISRRRRVIELAQTGMTGAGVVPRIGTLRSTGIHKLNDFQLEAGVELLEQYRQRGTHDARSDQYYINCFVMRH
ncbi:Homocysteine S-methyltransferase protein [Pseudomonas syringae pv. tomato]|nr:Homocysteine S-methyltransferase protein [Pseudomonas syringae pv. tomato]